MAVLALPETDGGSIPTSPLHRLRKQDWQVDGVDQDTALGLVTREHYARGASNTATYLHGLYPANWLMYAHCVGVAWWLPPTKSAAQAWAGDRWGGVLALSRLAVEPNVPDQPAQIIIVPDATIQAIARVVAPPGHIHDKPALMIEFDGVDGRMPVLVYSTDRAQGREMKSRATQ